MAIDCLFMLTPCNVIGPLDASFNEHPMGVWELSETDQNCFISERYSDQASTNCFHGKGARLIFPIHEASSLVKGSMNSCVFIHIGTSRIRTAAVVPLHVCNVCFVGFGV